MSSIALAAAAALLAVVLVFTVWPGVFGLQSETPQATGTALEMTKVAPTPINATVTLNSYGWGTRIDMACTYGDWGNRDAPPQNLGMVVVGRDGSQTEVATWLGLSGATALPSANTPMPIERNRCGTTGFRRLGRGAAGNNTCESDPAVNRTPSRVVSLAGSESR